MGAVPRTAGKLARTQRRRRRLTPTAARQCTISPPPGEATFARLTRQAHRCRMQVARGSFVTFNNEVNQALMRRSTFEWPHVFARLSAGSAEFLSRFGANHIHAVPGDRVAELQAACTFLGISFELLSATAGSLQLSGLARPAGVLSG